MVSISDSGFSWKQGQALSHPHMHKTFDCMLLLLNCLCLIKIYVYFVLVEQSQLNFLKVVILKKFLMLLVFPPLMMVMNSQPDFSIYLYSEKKTFLVGAIFKFFTLWYASFLTRVSSNTLLFFVPLYAPIWLSIHCKACHVCALLLFMLFIPTTRLNLHSSDKDGCQVGYI